MSAQPFSAWNAAWRDSCARILQRHGGWESTHSMVLRGYGEARGKQVSGMDLRRRAERSGKELITIAEQRDLSQIFYLDGGTYEAPAIVVVIQAINHAIDHRSQIATLLSQQDIEPPDLDGWAYNDAMHERS